MSEVINPLTGLPLTTPKTRKGSTAPTNPFTGGKLSTPRTRQASGQSLLNTTSMRSGNFAHDYGRYGVAYSPYADLEEARARNQSSWEQLGNGLYKAANTFAGAVSENTLGYAMGLGDYVLSGFEDFQESMTNNPVGKFFDERNEMLREAYPNYATAEEEAKKGTLSSLVGEGSVNFWADKFAGGAAYSLGSVATMMMTGGTTGALTGLGKAAKLGKGLAALTTARGVHAAKKAGDIAGLVAARAKNISNIANINRASNALGYLETGAMMSMAESSLEAREVYKQTLDALNNQAVHEMGLNSVEEIPMGERIKIEEIAKQKEALAFYGNMAVLMPTNLITFGKGIKPFIPPGLRSGSAAKIVGKQGERAGWRSYVQALDDLPGYAQKGIKAGQKAYPWLKRGATEAFQEGSQYVISEGLQERAKAMYEDYSGIDVAKGFLEGGLFATAREDFAEIGRDALETLDTPDGREQMLIGALVGIMTGGRGSIRENKRRSKATEEALTDLNLSPEEFFNLRERAKTSAISEYYLRRMDQAYARGDKKTYQDYQARLLNEIAVNHSRLGTYAQYTERLEELKAMPAEEVAKIIGVQELTEAEKVEMIDRIRKSSDNAVQVYERLNDAFPSPTMPTGLRERMMSKSAKQALRAQITENERLKTAMSFYESSLYDVDERIDEIIDAHDALDPKFDGAKWKAFVRDELYSGFGAQIKEDGDVDVVPVIGQTEAKRQELLDELKKSANRIRYGKKTDSELRSEYVGKHRKKNLDMEQQILVDLLNDRSTAVLAYEELMKNPEKRQAFLERQKIVEELEEQKAKDAQVDQAIQSTATHQELKARREGLQAAGVSDEALEKLEGEIIEREGKESDIDKEFSKMTRSEVQGLNPEDMDPVRKAVWKAHLKGRKQEAPLIAEPSPEAKKKAAGKKVTDEAESRSTQQALDNEEGRAEQQAPAGAAQEQAARTNRNAMTREARNGQFELDKNGNVLVDTTGNPTNLDKSTQHTANGVPIITNRALLHENVVGRQVTIVVREDADWWNNEATPKQKMDGAYWAPMYIEIDGQIVGVLDSSDSPMRQVAWQQAKEGNPRAVTTTVSKQLTSSIFSAVERNQQVPYFYNPASGLDEEVIMVVIGENPDGGTKQIEIGQFDEGLAKKYTVEQLTQLQKDISTMNELLNTPGKGGMSNIAMGQVGFLVQDPSGRFRLIVGQTANLTPAAVDKAVELMRSGDQAALRQLMGVNSNFLIDEQKERALGDKFFYAEDMGEQALFTFRPVNEEGQPLLPDGLMFQLSSEVIDRWYNGRRGSDLLSAADNKAKAELINFIVEPYRNEDGEVEFKPKFNEYSKEASAILENLDNILRAVLSRKKFQVDANLINNDESGGRIIDPMNPDGPGYATYFEYLTDEAAGALRDAGAKSIVATTARKVDGKTPFISIGLEFDTKYEVGGVTPAPIDGQNTANKTDQGEADVAPASVEAADNSTSASPSGNAEEFSPFDSSPLGFEDAEVGEKRTVIDERAEYEKAQKELEKFSKELDEADPERAAQLLRMQEMVEKARERNEKRQADAMYSELVEQGYSAAEARARVQQAFPGVKGAPRYTRSQEYEKLDPEQAKQWLRTRGIPVAVYDVQKRLRSPGILHGYTEAAGVSLWSQAEVGTEYHEAFHYMFRSMLTDKQRQGLYNEMRKKLGQDSALQEMETRMEEDLKRMFPDASQKEIDDLILEEFMAEEFRDYVLSLQETAQTLPQKIRKFFSDLYNYIKALITNPVSIRQFYSLIEADNIPKSFVRKAQPFVSDAKFAPRFRSTYAQRPELHNDLRDVISLQFEKIYFDNLAAIQSQDANHQIEELSPQSVGYIIGNANTKGEVADWFLSAALSDTFGGQLSEEQLTVVKTAIDSGNLSGLQQYFKEQGIKQMPNLGVHDGTLMLDENARRQVSRMYLDVYINWNDNATQDQFENPAGTGWRSVMLEALQQKGYSTGDLRMAGDYESMSDEQRQHFDKIYEKGHFEIAPNDQHRQSAKARIAISKIKAAKENRLGVVTYANSDTIVRKAISSAKNQQSTDNILNALRQAQRFNPELIPLVEHLDSKEISPAEHAMIVNMFRLDYTRHIVFDRVYEAGQKRVVQYDSDRMSQDRVLVERWRGTRAFEDVENADAFYIESPDGTVRVQNAEAKAAKLDLMVQTYQDTTRPLNDRIEALSDILWEMGLGITGSREKSHEIFKKYIEEKTREKNTVSTAVFDETDVLRDFGTKVMYKELIQSAFQARQMGGALTSISPKDNPKDMFTARTQKGKRRIIQGIKYLAKEIGPRIESMEAMGFVGGDGKMRYAYNLPTHLNYLMTQLSEGTALHQLMQKDQRFFAFGHTDFQDPLFILMKKAKFKPIVGEFDVIKNESDEVGKTTYKTLFERDSLITRIDAYLNSGNPTESMVALSTQETRPRLTFAEGLPKLTKTGAVTEYGINNNEIRYYVRNLIIQDMLGVVEAEKHIKNNPNDLIPGYHTKFGSQNKTYQVTHLLGRLNKDQLLLARRVHKAFSENKVDDRMGRNVLADVNEEVDAFMKKFDAAVADVRKQLKDYGVIREKEVKLKDGKKVKEVTHSFDDLGIKNEGGLNKAIRNFVANDMIYRISMAKAFRGGVNMFKSEVDFFKRMGLINTPGVRMYMQGDMAHDKFQRDTDYGMLKVFNTATITDFSSGLTPEDKAMHDKDAEGLYQALTSGDYAIPADEARKIASRYAGGVASATDAQTYISPEMYRRIEMGLGRWTDEDQKWYDEYLRGGAWKAKYTPSYKFYYENVKLHGGKTLTLDADKNSYFVITRDIAEINPIFKNMHDKMMDTVNPIHMINTQEAKKGSKEKILSYEQFAAKNEQGAFLTDNADIIVPQQGERLLMPQTIDDKGTSQVRLNKQITKNMLMLVDPFAPYILNKDTALEEEIASGTELRSQFHRSFTELQSRALQNLKADLGLDLADETTGLIPEANRLEALRKMRDMFLRQKMERATLSENVEAQLNLVADPITGQVDFALPLGFPTYLKEYENLFFSLFRTRVMKMMMNGKEMVQVGAPGKFMIDGEMRELRYLHVKDNGYVGHAEVVVSADIAKKYGLKPGDDLSQIPEELRRLVAYRIPHQGKSSTVIGKIVGILPASYSKAIMLPANLTEMTGSDFDIDKLFVMSPEFEGNRKQGFNKVAFDPSLELEQQSDAALRNRMLDIIEAISASPVHLAETFKPLATDSARGGKLENFAENELGKNLDKTEYPFWHPLVEVEMEQKFKASATGVGVYAKALAGYSIVSQGGAIRNGKNSTPVEGHVVFRMNGVLRDSIQSQRSVAEYFKEKLSSHLDSGKKPIPGVTNDNKFTHAATVFLGSFITDETYDADVRLIEGLMNIPAVLKFVRLRKGIGSDKGPLSVRMALKEMGIGFNDQKLMVQGEAVDDKFTIHDTTDAEVMSIVKAKKLSKEQSDLQDKLFKNFAYALIRGEQLQEVYEIVAPDTLDGLGEIGEIQAYIGKLEKYRRLKKPVVSVDALLQFLVDDKFGISASYYKTMQEMLKLSNNFFASSSTAMSNFKLRIMEATGKTDFTGAQHRSINRAAFYWMLTKPKMVTINGREVDVNPLADLLTEDNMKEMFLNKRSNISNEARNLRKIAPALDNNYIISRLQSPKRTKNTRTYGLEMNNLDEKSVDMKNRMKRDFQLLLERPEMYSPDQETVKRIKRFAELLVLNSLVRTAASPTYGSYFDSIPAEYFMNKRRSEVKDENGTPLYPSVSEFVRSELSQAQNSPSYFTPFMFEYIRNFGTSKIDGQDLLRTVKTTDGIEAGAAPLVRNQDGTYTLTRSPYGYPAFIKIRNPRPRGKSAANAKADRFTILQKKTLATYEVVQQKSINGKLFEVNVRDENGRVEGTDSLISSNRGRQVSRVGAKHITPFAAQLVAGSTDRVIADNQALQQKLIQQKCG